MTKYARIAEVLRKQIQSGALQPGDRLPSFAEMSSTHGASLPTTNRIFAILEEDGLITRVQGKGTFVAAREKAAGTEDPSAGKRIGLIVPSCTGHFFSELIHGVEEAADANGFHVIVSNSRGDGVLEQHALKSLKNQTAGLCILPCEEGNYAAYAELLQENVPFVFLDRSLPKLAVPMAATDNEQGGYLATQHLLATGRKRIWVLSEGNASSVKDRVRGYRRALQEAGVPFDPARVLHGTEYGDAAGVTLTRELLHSGAAKAPFALFALNDTIARGAYLALREANLQIPRDVAVIGFDDDNAPHFAPPLSSVRQDLHGMGAGAVRLLVDVMRGSQHAPRAVVLPPQLVVRNSSDTKSDFCVIDHVLQGGPATRAGGTSPANRRKLRSAQPVYELQRN